MNVVFRLKYFKQTKYLQTIPKSSNKLHKLDYIDSTKQPKNVDFQLKSKHQLMVRNKLPSAPNSLSVRYNFRLTDYRKLNSILSRADWSFFYQCTSVDEAVQSFNALLTSALLSCTPIFRSPAWIWLAFGEVLVASFVPMPPETANATETWLMRWFFGFCFLLYCFTRTLPDCAQTGWSGLARCSCFAKGIHKYANASSPQQRRLRGCYWENRAKVTDTI